MKLLKSIIVLFFIFTIACSNSDKNIDTEKPTIDMANGFPTNCVVIKRGEPFTFKALFKDNQALAAYSIDIHNNFDHHTHSTEIEPCDLLPKKKPITPFKLIKTYTIEGNPKSYEAQQNFVIGKEYDAGDYHFHIKIVDGEGWATIKGLSIRLE